MARPIGGNKTTEALIRKLALTPGAVLSDRLAVVADDESQPLEVRCEALTMLFGVFAMPLLRQQALRSVEKAVSTITEAQP
jgi:hypothetical protein